MTLTYEDGLYQDLTYGLLSGVVEELLAGATSLEATRVTAYLAASVGLIRGPRFGEGPTGRADLFERADESPARGWRPVSGFHNRLARVVNGALTITDEPYAAVETHETFSAPVFATLRVVEVDGSGRVELGLCGEQGGAWRQQGYEVGVNAGTWTLTSWLGGDAVEVATIAGPGLEVDDEVALAVGGGSVRAWHRRGAEWTNVLGIFGGQWDAGCLWLRLWGGNRVGEVRVGGSLSGA